MLEQRKHHQVLTGTCRVITVDGNDISKLSPVEANRLLVGAEGSVAGNVVMIW